MHHNLEEFKVLVLVRQENEENVKTKRTHDRIK